MRTIRFSKDETFAILEAAFEELCQPIAGRRRRRAALISDFSIHGGPFGGLCARFRIGQLELMEFEGKIDQAARAFLIRLEGGSSSMELHEKRDRDYTIRCVGSTVTLSDDCSSRFVRRLRSLAR